MVFHQGGGGEGDHQGLGGKGRSGGLGEEGACGGCLPGGGLATGLTQQRMFTPEV